MKPEVQILAGRVSVRLGDLRMSFPDEPFWWEVSVRTARTIADLASAQARPHPGAPDAEGG